MTNGQPRGRSAAARRILPALLGMAVGLAVVTCHLVRSSRGPPPEFAGKSLDLPVRGARPVELAAQGRPRSIQPLPSEARTVRVRVVGPLRQPLAASAMRAVEPGALLTSDVAERPVAAAGEGGVFTVQREARGGRVWDWVVEAPGHVPRLLEAATVSELDSDEIEVSLEEGLTLRGRIVDDAGRPLGGASVAALGRFGDAIVLVGRDRLGSVAAADLTTSVSGDDGSFEIRGVAGLPVFVRAWKAHHLDAGAASTTPVMDEPLTLRSLKVVAVEVLDADLLAPVPTSQLVRGTFGDYSQTSLSRWSRSSDSLWPGWDREHRVYSMHVTRAWRGRDGDDRGRVRGPVRLSFGAPGYAVAEVEVVPIPLPAVGASPPVRALLRRTSPRSDDGAVRVRVSGRHAARIDPLTLSVVAEASADAQRPPASHLIRAGRDAEGLATFELPSGGYRVKLASGTGWAGWTAEDGPGALVHVRSGETTEVSLDYDAVLVTFRAQTRGGLRLPEYFMQISSHGEAVRSVAFTGEALGGDAFGRPSVELNSEAVKSGARRLLLSPGEYSVAVSAPGLEPLYQGVVVRPGDDQDVLLTLDSRREAR